MIKFLKNIIKKYIIPYRPLMKSKSNWDNQFKDGSWDYLNDIQQLSRYSVILGYYNYFIENGNILDLGCGQGVLLQRLKSFKFKDYVGVDISEKAIEMANEKKLDNSKFIASDLTKYTPEMNFDFIIFNESLYYLDKPLEILDKYQKYLNENGKIVISMWDNPERNNKLWSQINKKYKIWDVVKLQSHSDKVNWIIELIN